MAVLISSTLSGEYSNSYVGVAYADEFFESHFDTTKTDTWSALSDDQKQMLLVQATMIVEQFKFTYTMERRELALHYDARTGKVHDFMNVPYPVRYTWNQALQFPRNLDVDSVTGLTYIPEPIKIAQCEQSISLKNFNVTSTTKVLAGIKSERVELPGPIIKDVTYQDGDTVSSFITSASVSPLALQYLGMYLVSDDHVYRS